MARKGGLAKRLPQLPHAMWVISMKHSFVIAFLILSVYFWSCHSDGSSTSALNTPAHLDSTTQVWSFIASGSRLFAATSGKGIFVSTNEGLSWEQAISGLTDLDVRCLATRGSALYAGTGGGQVFRSTDAGRTWTATSLASKFVYALVTNATVLFAGTDQGVFQSTDDGVSWNQANAGLTNIFVRSMMVDGSEMFSGTAGGGVFRSTNAGSTWSPLNNGLPTIYIVRTLATNGPYLFAGTEGGLYLSTSRGTSWSASSLTQVILRCMCVSQTSLFAGGNGLFVSTDNGVTWSTSRLPEFVQALFNNGSYMVAGTLHGVFRSTDNGMSWLASNGGS